MLQPALEDEHALVRGELQVADALLEREDAPFPLGALVQERVDARPQPPLTVGQDHDIT